MSEKPEAWTAADSLIWPHLAAKLIREQHAENERLREELKEDTGVIAVWRGRTERAESENERLREALAWIAKRCLMHLEVALDAGACARAALRREDV